MTECNNRLRTQHKDSNVELSVTSMRNRSV